MVSCIPIPGLILYVLPLFPEKSFLVVWVFYYVVKIILDMRPSYRNVLRYAQILPRWARWMFDTAGRSHMDFL